MVLSTKWKYMDESVLLTAQFSVTRDRRTSSGGEVKKEETWWRERGEGEGKGHNGEVHDLEGWEGEVGRVVSGVDTQTI